MSSEPTVEFSDKSVHDDLLRLRAELNLYKQVIAGNRDGLWHRDLNTGILWVSDRWWEMLGYPPEDAPKHQDDFRRLVHPEDIPKMEIAVRSHLSAEADEYRCQYRLKDGNGDWRTVLSRGRALREKTSGNFTHIVGSHFDVTENAAKEQEEKRLGQVYDRVFHSIPHLIVVKNELDQFIYVNKALAEFWGEKDPKKLVGKCDADYNPDKEEVSAFLKADAEVRRTRQPKVISIEKNTDYQKKKHWLNTIKVPLINDDGTVFVVIVATFIDDVMEMAEKVKQQEEVPKLARNIAHKLGTRIFTLRNLVAITHHGADEDDLNAAFDDITQFAEDFLKLTSADRIVPQPFNLLSLIHGVLKSFAEKAKITLNGAVVRSGGDAVSKFGDPLPYEMTGDSTKLFDVFAELAKNSLAWKKEDTHRISVSVQPLHLTQPSMANLPGTGRYQIIFEDNGPGVPQNQKQKIFEPFISGRAASLVPENGDAITAAKNDHSGSGTGLGLAIADEVMKSHGGYIMENGTPGAGARFVITLMKRPPEQNVIRHSSTTHP